MTDVMLNRRAYLVLRACIAGASWPVALEAVASTAIKHPEWDMEERRTVKEWLKEVGA